MINYRNNRLLRPRHAGRCYEFPAGAPFEGNGRCGRADAADTFQFRRAKLHNQSGLLGRGRAYPPARIEGAWLLRGQA